VEAIKPAPKVLEVVIADLEFLHFVDDGLEVREGTYGARGGASAGRSNRRAAARSKAFSTVFSGQFGRAVSGQQTVLATDVSRGPRGLAVGVEDLADILFRL